jgi:iron complex transport system permease protein
MSTASDLTNIYNKNNKRKIFIILSFFLALLLVTIFAISFGAGSPRFTQATNVIFSHFFHLEMPVESQITQLIVLDLRLPRIILAMIAGTGLASSGTTMQGALQNPLVSSYVLGISSAAGFGAAFAIAFGSFLFSGHNNYIVVASAFGFSLLAMLLVYFIARLRGMTAETIILAGVAVGYLFSALISLIQYIIPEHEVLEAIVFWLMGGLTSVTWESIFIPFVIVSVTLIFMMQQSWNLNVMSLGEEAATSVGVNSKHVLVICMTLSTLSTASVVAFTGVIGFVGLTSPHISRLLVGNDNRFLLPCSAVVGALLLLCSDTAARLVIMPIEIPVGIITSLLGVPFFIYLLYSRKRKRWS